jgi:hypothetical protein
MMNGYSLSGHNYEKQMEYIESLMPGQFNPYQVHYALVQNEGDPNKALDMLLNQV